MKFILIIVLLVNPFQLYACELISQFGFEFSDDLPVQCDGMGIPSDRHSARPIGSTESSQGFYEYLPQGYENDQQDYPLLVFIHGLGENGNGDSQLDDLLVTGIPRIIDQNNWDETLPFVVLSPQNSSGGCTSSSDIFNFINFAKENYRININRVYLTGLSCGAIGSWNYLGNHSNAQIAAVVPIAGNGNSAFNNGGCEMNRVPIWAFHGDNDGTVGVGGTTGPINNLLACTDPAPIDTSMIIYPGVGHNSWQRTYDLSEGHDIYQWFLSKKNITISEPSPLGVNRMVHIDFGSSAAPTPSPWSNINSISGGLANLIDDEGQTSTINISITESFTGTNQNGIGMNQLNIPETVTSDNFWVGSFDGHAEALLESATVSITGLDPNAIYSIEIYASNSGDDGGNGRLTRYTIGNQSQDLEVSDNTINSILFDALTDTENIELNVNVSPEGNGRFAYLGGITITRDN